MKWSTNNTRNTKEAVWGTQYSPRLSCWSRPIGLQSVWWPRGVLWPEYCLWGVSYFYYPTIFMLCSCNAIIFIFWKERSIAARILPTPNTSLSSLPVGSKCMCTCKHVNLLIPPLISSPSGYYQLPSSWSSWGLVVAGRYTAGSGWRGSLRYRSEWTARPAVNPPTSTYWSLRRWSGSPPDGRADSSGSLALKVILKVSMYEKVV